MKIKCVEKLNTMDWFTVGEVYEVKGGTVADNQGYCWEYCDDIDHINNVRFFNFFRFELVNEEPSTPSKPTKEQLRNLKPGDKVRLRSDRGAIWRQDGGMDNWFNQVVTIDFLEKTIRGKDAFRILEDKWLFEFTDIVEIISSEPEPIKEPVKEPVKATKPWKESLIDQIKQLPFEGGIIALSVCERERARIIELIEAM